MNSDYWDELRSIVYFVGTITGALGVYWSQVGRMELAALAGAISGACFVFARRIKPNKPTAESVRRLIDQWEAWGLLGDKSPVKSDATPSSKPFDSGE